MKAALSSPAPQKAARKLSVIVEGRYGSHQRLELLVAPGTTVADLRLDVPRRWFELPGGAVVGATDDLFELAADCPRLFALSDPLPATAGQVATGQRTARLNRVLRRGGRAMAAIAALPGPRHGVVP